MSESEQKPIAELRVQIIMHYDDAHSERQTITAATSAPESLWII